MLLIDQPCGHARRYATVRDTSSHNGVRADYGPASDPHIWKDHRPDSDKSAVPDFYGRSVVGNLSPYL